MKKLANKILSFTLAVILTIPIINSEAASAASFTDVSSNAWYAKAVNYATEHKYMNGVGNDRFAPEGSMTRAMFVQVLANLTSNYKAKNYTGNTHFTDVPSDTWYSKAVQWAYEKGVVNGTSATTFSPDTILNRETMVTMLFNYAKQTKNDVKYTSTKLNSFSDSGNTSSWAKKAMAWATSKNIISGTSKTNVSPKGNASRAQAAQIFMNIDKRDILLKRDVISDSRPTPTPIPVPAPGIDGDTVISMVKCPQTWDKAAMDSGWFTCGARGYRTNAEIAAYISYEYSAMIDMSSIYYITFDGKDFYCYYG
jgi:S-layer homology domain.